VAVLRSLVLLVVLYLVLVSTPWEVFGAGDSMIKVQHLRGLVKATGIAMGFIALETAIGWFLALRKPKGAGGGAAGGAAKSSVTAAAEARTASAPGEKGSGETPGV